MKKGVDIRYRICYIKKTKYGSVPGLPPRDTCAGDLTAHTTELLRTAGLVYPLLPVLARVNLRL